MFIKHVKNMSGRERLDEKVFILYCRKARIYVENSENSIFLSKYLCSEVRKDFRKVRKDFFMKTFIYVARRYIVDVALPIKLVLAKPVVIFYFEAAGGVVAAKCN